MRKIFIFSRHRRSQRIFAALILILSINSVAQVLSYDRYKKFEYPGKNWFNLKGKVKLIQQKTFEAVLDSGKIKQDKEKPVNYFNEREYFQFNNQGNLISEAAIWNGDTLNPKTSYSYNSNVISVKEESSNRVIFRQKYIFEPLKQLLTIQETYDQTPEVNKIFKMYYAKDSTLDSVMQFNPKGLIIEIARFIKNKKKQVISEESFMYGTTSFIKKEYVHNEKGRVIQQRLYRLGSFESTTASDYDDIGNIISESTVYGSQKNNIRYQYEYDKKLNWIKRTLFIDDKPIEIGTREISYY